MNAEAEDLVTIIIPIYNVENYIKDCLRSVLNQTHNNIEIILIDDLGTDKSIQIAKSILSNEQVSWKIIHHEKNRGLSAARNTGIQYASGKFAYFLDSDDVITHDCISLLVNKANENGADIVFGNYRHYQGDSLESEETSTSINFINDTIPIQVFFDKNTPVTAWNRLINLTWYIKSGVKFIEGILHEDMAWSLSCALRCNKVASVDKVTYLYRYRNGSIMHNSNYKRLRIKSRIAIIKEACRELNYYFTEWPKEALVQYSRQQWGIALDIYNSTDPDIKLLLKDVFKDSRIPTFNSPDKIFRIFYFLRNIVPSHIAFLILIKLYSRVI